MVRDCPSADEALALAVSLYQARYDGAAFGFVAGSIMRGEGTRLSDIDLVILYDHLPAARRESFLTDDVPVEVFVHDPETLNWFVDQDIARGRPSLLNMIVEGRVIGPRPDDAEALRRTIADRLEAGPPALSPVALDALRYEITDAIDDLRGRRTLSEMLAIGAQLHPRMVELALRGRDRWNGTGKWAPRLLDAAEAGLAARFDDAFRALFASGETHLLIALADAELAPHGGPLFAGDHRVAPASSRI